MSHLRRAQREDNPQLLELFDAVPMQGELVLATQRSPDFFRLYDMQRGEAELWVNEVEDGLDGMGAILVRDGWLEGRPCRVGYLGDLRTRFSARRSRGSREGKVAERRPAPWSTRRESPVCRHPRAALAGACSSPAIL